MKFLSILFNILFYIFVTLATLFIIFNLGAVLWDAGLKKLFEVMSPFKIMNYVALLILYLPAIIFKVLSGYFKNKIRP